MCSIREKDESYDDQRAENMENSYQTPTKHDTTSV